MTAYIIDMAVPVPGEDAHTRMVSEPVEFSELSDLFFDGCRELWRRGHRDDPWCHVLAVEDDGGERPLTPVEQAAFGAQLEQAAGGMRATFTRDDGSPA